MTRNDDRFGMTSEQKDRYFNLWTKILTLLKNKMDQQVFTNSEKNKLANTNDITALNELTKELNDKYAIKLDKELKEAMLDLLDLYYELEIGIVNLDHSDEGFGNTLISMQKFFVSDALYQAFKARHPEITNWASDETLIKPIKTLASSKSEWDVTDPNFWIYDHLDRDVDLYIGTHYTDDYSTITYNYVTKDSIKELLKHQDLSMNTKHLQNLGDLHVSSKLLEIFDGIFNPTKKVKVTK